MSDPYILIDAWFFDGFDYKNGDVERCGLSGSSIRVKKGELTIESSWGDLDFCEGDKIVIVDIAASIASKHSNRRILKLGPIEATTLTLLHELSHWAEEQYRPDREHSQTWNPFLASIDKQMERTRK